jgi:hypothetical protein
VKDRYSSKKIMFAPSKQTIIIGCPLFRGIEGDRHGAREGQRHIVVKCAGLGDSFKLKSADCYLDVAPAPSNSSTVLFNQLLKRNAHLLLYHNRVVYVSRYAEQFGALHKTK